ncbi:phosphorylcholine transferase LicD [Treponema sp. C6A8]|uniref:LicD family protein n=1 Tax=Treponema sp. C6A8 TaxID=1410609 RepID=UPI000684B9A9|nr:LicD family protein [Treponema sp. C6A8]
MNNYNCPENFLKEDERCEYKVSTKLKKIWAVEIDLYQKFAEVCDKYNIKYFAWAGTLLGAIRHKGFIPWDDDFDIGLLREDYEKLIKIAPKELKHPYFLQNMYSDKKYFCAYSRFRNSETTGAIVGTDTPDYNNGIYIDIFVLDGKPEDEKELKRWYKKRDYVSFLINHFESNFKYSHGFKKLLHYVIKGFVKIFFSYDRLCKKYNKIVQKYNNKCNCVGLMTHSYDFIHKYYCTKESLEQIVSVPFEYTKINIPKNYDEPLRNMYGSYMEFPPISKRGIWHNGQLIFDPDTPYKEFLSRK